MLESKDGAGIMTFCKNGEADQITWKDAVRKGHALASYFMANGIEKKKIAIIGGYSSKSYIMFVCILNSSFFKISIFLYLVGVCNCWQQSHCSRRRRGGKIRIYR